MSRRAQLALAFAAAVIAIAIAFSTFRGSSAFAYRSLWPADVPGTPAPGHELARQAASKTGVDPSSLRVVKSIENAGVSYSLLAGADGAHRPCFSIDSRGFTLGFECLGRSSTRSGSALVYYATASGGEPRTVDRAVIVGIARNDVTRISLSTVSGALVDLPLNQWRGFAYSAASADALPRKLVAYGSSGKIEERVDVQAQPLCGGPSGACPS
jgi:hypothetical protein